MSSQINKYFYEQKLEYLLDQNNQLRQQNQLFKSTNDNLIKTLAQSSQNAQDFNFEIRNRQLQEMVEMQRKRYEELENRKYQQIRSYKEELNERNNEIERMRIQHQKQFFRLTEEIRSLKAQLRERRNENHHYDELSKSIAVSSYLVDLKNSEENSIDRSNNLNYTNIERLSNKSPLQSHAYNMQKSTANISSFNSSQLMKYSKDELKVGIRALTKAGKSLREGQREVSMIQERQSILKSKKC